MNVSEQLRLLKSSKQIHSTWYRETYPEVAELNMDPALHYLRYGAAMGRNPGKNFDTRFYLRNYPDVAKSGLNPLLHYVLHGKAKGYATRPQESPGAKHVATVRTKLLSLGFTERPLQELADIQTNAQVPETRALAARELALWHMRQKTPEGYRTALTHLAAAREDAPNLDFRRKLAVAELLCHYFLGDEAEGRASYERAALAGEISPDLLLSLANFERSPEARVALMNRVLRHYDIPPITLLPDETLSPYDRLTLAEPLDAVTVGPKVTVLIAAYDAADMLPTALRSLQEQTWKNLEILVLDDCSPTPETAEVAQRFAADDPRIRLIRMEQNGGAYVARNRGLDEATGEYVTLHDADDWSHPKKIETQVRFMEANHEVMGCTTQQARAGVELDFLRLTQGSNLITSNTSSFLWRRVEVAKIFGCWDTVRFGADTDLMKRVEHHWKKEALVRIPSGPLSFQRNQEASAVNDITTAADGLPFGIRKEYQELRKNKIDDGVIKADGSKNLLAPLRMRSDRSGYDQVRHFDMVLASDFRMQGGSIQSSVQEIHANKKFGIRTGLLPMYRYDFPPDRSMEAVVRQEIDENILQLLSYGDRISCDLLILRYPPILYHHQKFLPKIAAKEIKVIINQPPMSDYGPEGVVRYNLADCADNIRHYFGKDATWHPIGPLVRGALHQHHSSELVHINLSNEDWSNIIDISGWEPGPRKRGSQNRLRIGRHSRDHEHKWPNTREDILAAYPAVDDVEVHVLGGATSPASLIGQIPANWVVHPFGSVHPRDFLKDIDVWIYFSHPYWLESFGRTIIEAMATGVPVILPEVYRPLFEDAAIYATPQTAVEIARKLHADPLSYDAQVRRAQAYVQDKFSFEMHVRRIKESVGLFANESVVEAVSSDKLTAPELKKAQPPSVHHLTDDSLLGFGLSCLGHKTR